MNIGNQLTKKKWNVSSVNFPGLKDYYLKNNFYKIFALMSWAWIDCSFYYALRILRALEEILDKVSFFMNRLNKPLKMIYCLNKKLPIVDSMVLWWSCLLFHQLIKNKIHKYCVKCYEIGKSNEIILWPSICCRIP